MSAKEEISCPICECRDYKVVYEPWIKEEDPKKTLWCSDWNSRNSKDR